MDAQPVIVGVDGSSDSVRALQWAAEYARDNGARIQVLAVFDRPSLWGPLGMAGWEDTTDLEADRRKMLGETVREALGEFAELEERVLAGHPAEALVRASEGARLMVVGSRGRGGFAGLLLGSVSQHVIAHSRCPVVVIPHESEPEH
ncbi:universal stress protein [Dietzia alimentaria]|uniref:universal stress protein n=1 Tax=Dietzia alimentaria TaxID=665550 RepID=UPI00029AA80C|nr:universal stress protein [Dietzia alimentaria]